MPHNITPPNYQIYKENKAISSNYNVGRMIPKNRIRKLDNYLDSQHGVQTLYHPLAFTMTHRLDGLSSFLAI